MSIELSQAYISRDGRTIYIFAHSCTVYVGLTPARPNYAYTYTCARTE